MNKIPESHLDLLDDNKKAFAYLATVMKDGSPQVTPVWFNFDGEFLMINSAEGRVKDKNIRSHPNVALTIQDPGDPYRYLQVRGRVVEFTHAGADAHIDALSMKYTSKPKYQWRSDQEKRMRYKICIEKVDAH